MSKPTVKIVNSHYIDIVYKRVNNMGYNVYFELQLSPSFFKQWEKIDHRYLAFMQEESKNETI